MKKWIFLTVFISITLTFQAEAREKQSDLAGMWYSKDPRELKAELESYLADAKIGEIKGDVIGVISPHAGYRYSGSVAAYAFKAAMTQNPDKIIVVGFTHRRHFPGISVFTGDAYVTPLGKAVVDRDISRKLIASSDKIESIPEAFDNENSVEMMIPFIQAAFKDAKIVLVAIGDQSLQNTNILANALYDALRDEKSYVIVASTDMLHYRPYRETNIRDGKTIGIIEKLDSSELYFASLKERHELMCGPGAVCAVMMASEKLGANEVKILKYANSGDTSGVKNKVVGYLSAAFIKQGQGSTLRSAQGHSPRKETIGMRVKGQGKEEEDEMFTGDQKKKLLKMARDTIHHYLETGEALEVESDEAFMEEMGAFVTLHKSGQLRGCIGHIVGDKPFYLTVRNMAIASAVEDPRFPSVRLDELDDIDIEISALSPMKKIDDYNEIQIPGHGVMVRRGWQSGVYLPQVATETGWDREEFMNSLCAQKAGIPMDAWKTGECEIYVFTAEVFGEKDE